MPHFRPVLPEVGLLTLKSSRVQEENWGRSVSGHSFSRRGPLTPIRHHKKKGGYLVEYPPLVSSSKQEIYCPDAEAVVAARAICFSVACAGTLNRNVMPNSGNCMAVT